MKDDGICSSLAASLATWASVHQRTYHTDRVGLNYPSTKERTNDAS